MYLRARLPISERKGMSPWYSFTATDTVNSTAQLSIYLRAEDQLSVLVQAGDPGGRRDQHSPDVHMHRPAIGKLGSWHAVCVTTFNQLVSCEVCSVNNF